MLAGTFVQGLLRELSATASGTIEHQNHTYSVKGTFIIKVKAKPKDLFKGLHIVKKVKEKEMVVFTRQFATMIDAGLPLVQCLDILSSQQDNPVFKNILMTPCRLSEIIL
jgi:type II secretory pathway component PulF